MRLTSCARSGEESAVRKDWQKSLSQIGVNVAADAATFFFDLCEVRTLVPVRFRVVVIGDRIDSGGFGSPAGKYCICHADDRRGIHSSTKFGEDGAVRAQPAPAGSP